MDAFIEQIKRQGKAIDDRTDACGWVTQWQTCMMALSKRKKNT